MTSVSKIVFIDKLDDIVNKYYNMYDSTIKMKPVDVKSYILTIVKTYSKDREFKIYDIVRISKYKNFLYKFLQKFHSNLVCRRFCD